MQQLKRDPATLPKREIKALQYGEGNFLRAFVDWIIDVANEQGVTDMGIAVVSPRFRENASIKALKEQDGAYHTVLEGVAGGKPARATRLVGSVSEALAPEADYDRYIEIVESPVLRFVFSNTTEAGIRYEPDDASAKLPATFPGKVAAMLHRRWQHFGGNPDKGLIFICCELIEDNGQQLRECVLRQASDAGFEPEFMQWVREACTFCDSLVDRIVSGFPADDIDQISSELGCADKLVVKGELYHLWAIGGKGSDKAKAELPLHRTGLNVMFLPSLKEIRDRKVRILNGSHTGMVPIALQLGCATVLDAFSDEQVNAFIHSMMQSEVLPAIDGDSHELQAFADGILERFYNPYIRHMLQTIALNSLSKWETRNWCTALDHYKRTGEQPRHEAFTLAALLSLYSPESGFEPNDNAAHVAALRKALADNDDPAEAARKIMGAGIFSVDFDAAAPGFASCVGRYLGEIRQEGMRQALADFLAENEEKH